MSETMKLDPTGVEDSTEALQRLLDLCGELPPGTYRISRTLYLGTKRKRFMPSEGGAMKETK